MPNRAQHQEWLLDITSIPTAAGKEQRVIHWIERWVADRPELTLTTDPAGNLVISRKPQAASRMPPLFITAHLDHPAFVIERFLGPTELQLSFRGGVNNPYFTNAPIVLFTKEDKPIRATITSTQAKEPWRECTADVAGPSDAEQLAVGDIGRWDVGEAHIDRSGGDDIIYTHACDDLSAVAAALSTMDELLKLPAADVGHVHILFTRAEEVGFIGAIAACRHKTIPENARLLALENSRSFPHDSPIGAGPIVRVGDRISTFSPALTAACAKVADDLVKKNTPETQHPFKYQRKLMAGGACEASCFCAYGYEATCLCLPLGNYHNMANLEKTSANDPEAVANARCGPEYVSLSDYHNLITLLIACATNLTAAESPMILMDKLYTTRGHVLTT